MAFQSTFLKENSKIIVSTTLLDAEFNSIQFIYSLNRRNYKQETERHGASLQLPTCTVIHTLFLYHGERKKNRLAHLYCPLYFL